MYLFGTSTREGETMKTKAPLFNGRIEGKFGRYCSRDKARVDCLKWIESAQLDGTVFPVCTNTMLDRGTVYQVRIVDGRAIAVSKARWWAMSYTAPVECREDLGTVVAETISGQMVYRPVVKNEKGHTILRYGRG
jgi:hypothetical protein